LPVQSGSDRVLDGMRRGYTASWYLERVSALRAAVPGIALTTDIIIGFPGETDDDFQATLDIVEAAAFDGAFTFVYSPRTGTAAADLPGQVPEVLKKERVRHLIAVTQQQGLERRSRLVGATLEVLVEGPSRRGDEWRGRTRGNVTVNFSGDTSPGRLATVHITAASSTTLKGRM
jgi:tRNA-2-methylthio-N6-dimethylallyladenosine synthase